jgi:hypothetical protein
MPALFAVVVIGLSLQIYLKVLLKSMYKNCFPFLELILLLLRSFSDFLSCLVVSRPKDMKRWSGKKPHSTLSVTNVGARKKKLERPSKRIKKGKNVLFLYSFLGHEAGEAAELSILPLLLLLLLLLLLVLLHLRHLQVLLLYLRVDLLRRKKEFLLIIPTNLMKSP